MDVFRRITNSTTYAPEGRAAFAALSAVSEPAPAEPAAGDVPDAPESEAPDSGADPGDESESAAPARDARDTRAEGDEEEDDEEVDDPAAPIDQRFKQVAKSLNKHKRRLAKLAPTVRALKDAGITDVRAFLTEAQEARQLVAALKQNPRAVFQALGLSQVKDEPAAPAERESADDFDPKSLPFDVTPDDPLTEFMANLARQVHDLTRENRQLKQGFTQEQASKQRQVEAAQRKEWSTAVSQAEAELPKPLRTLFRDAMVAAFQMRDRHRRPVGQIIDHYLGEFRKAGQINAKTERIASQAARERGAATNKTTWPTSPVGGGVPAPAARPKRLGLTNLGKKIRSGDFSGTSLAARQ